jgi:hypothetical protein
METPQRTYWNQINQNTPLALQSFATWLDSYKANIGWDHFFQKNVRFADTPFLVQKAMVTGYLSSLGYRISIWIDRKTQKRYYWSIVKNKNGIVAIVDHYERRSGYIDRKTATKDAFRKAFHHIDKKLKQQI